MDLTVQDIHNFVDEINTARQRAGMEKLTEIEFDESEPSDGYNCLSAHHLFNLLGAYTGGIYAESYDKETAVDVSAALGTQAHYLPGKHREWVVPIPKTILKVTDVFDGLVDFPEERECLRGLFVEAGYVIEAGYVS